MELLRFGLAVVFAFFIPGNLLIKKVDLPPLIKLCLSLVVGIVLWGYQGFILGFLNFRVGTYFYLAGATLLWLYTNRRLKLALPKISLDPLLLVILAVGIIFQVSAVWFIGTPTDQGLFFCCRGVPDDIYHLALTDQLVKNVPPFEPGSYGVIVQNYHYWSNLIMAETVRIFGTDLMTTVYKFFPVLLATLLAGAVVAFSHLLNLGKVFARWLALFVFFAGDVLFLLTWLYGQGLNFNVYALDDATKLLTGPPRSFSIVVIFWAFCLLIVWLKKRNLLLDGLIILLFASLAGMKLYTSIFALVGLGSLAGYYLLTKDFRRLFMPVVTLILSILIFLPVNGTGNGITFHWPWIFRETLARPDFGLVDLELRRRIFANDGKVLHAFFYEVYFAALYILFVFGTNLLALIQSKKSLGQLPKSLNIFLISAIGITTVFGFASSTKIGGANTIQFIVSLYLFLAIYAALALTHLQDRWPKKLRVAVVILVVILTVAKAGREGLQNFVLAHDQQGFMVGRDELAALMFLKSVPDKNALVVLDPTWADKETSMHVSFLADKPVFLAGYFGVVYDHQVVGSTLRRETNQKIWSSTDKDGVQRLLLENKIKYLYLPTASKLQVGNMGGQITPVFANSEAKVLRFSAIAR